MSSASTAMTFAADRTFSGKTPVHPLTTESVSDTTAAASPPCASNFATIAAADSSYFFENYTKQAQAVIATLEKGAGWTVRR